MTSVRAVLRETEVLARVGHWDLDLVSGDLRWSDGVFGVFGLPREKFGGSYEAFLALIHPDDRDTVNRTYRESVEQKRPYRVEHRLLLPDGQVKWVQEAGRTDYDAAGRPVRSIGTIQDITERKVAERALQASEEKHRLLFEFSGDAIFIVDAGGKMLAVNPTASSRLGYTHAELMRMPLGGVDTPEQATHAHARMAEVLEHGNATFETVQVCKDGLPVPTEVNARRITWDGRDAIIATCRDITRRKRAEAAAKAENERLRQVSAMMSDIAYSCRDDGAATAIEWMVGATERVIGYTVDELKAMRCWSGLVVAEDLPVFRANVIGLSPGTNAACELRLRHKDGRIVWLSSRAECLRAVDGDCARIVYGALVDITARKLAEDEKVRLQAQLEQAQKLESIGRLAGGVAHDFNNMLEVILGHAELALEQLDGEPPMRADLEAIRTAAERSADLTRQLLAFARRQMVTPRVLDLNVTVAGTLGLLQRLVGADIVLEWKPAGEVWPVRMDPSQVDQILANLCVNARDAIAGPGRIVIETGTATIGADAGPEREPGDYVVVSVWDDGCGMDEATRSHIFEPFYTTKPQGKGTGLGLATVYGAVMQNGGFVDVRSAPGRGSTFTIGFPRHVDRAGAANPGVSPA